jgi:transcriptional regulator with XRE-family HTH domain
MSERVDPAQLRYEAAVRGLSATDLAKKAGVSVATLSNAFAGKAISATTLKLIATALTATPVDDVIARLLGRGVKPPDGDQPPPSGEA